MKLLKCEVCGSAELTKKDGLFVCDYCGAKYDLEEVKKMVEGKVDVSGSITIDNSDKLKNFVIASHDALIELNFNEARRCAEEALSVNPNNPDALLVLAECCLYCDPMNGQGYCNRAKKNAEQSLGIVT